jgi:isoaspartyl peptidase/L-asparaginase-like protein (Ntn-hydrolase superfamily)
MRRIRGKLLLIRGDTNPGGDKADPECGGVIALDARGNFAFEFNTPGMYRGLMQEDENPQSWIYR